MSRDERLPRETEYDDWEIEDEQYHEARYVGLLGGTQQWFYSHRDNTLFEGEVDDENRRIRPVADSERELGPEDTVGKALENLGDELGWDSLSEFAEEHLEGDEDESTT